MYGQSSSFPATIKDCIDSLDRAVIADTLHTLVSRMSSFPDTIKDCIDLLGNAVIVTLWSL